MECMAAEYEGEFQNKLKKQQRHNSGSEDNGNKNGKEMWYESQKGNWQFILIVRS